MLHHDAALTKRRLHDGLRRVASAPADRLLPLLSDIMAPDVRWTGCDPLGEIRRCAEVEARFWRPLKLAFPDLCRRDDIFVGGSHSDHDWIAACGHYFGTFERDWLGIRAHRKWTHIRYGEFYRISDGLIDECFILIDMVDLLRQAGFQPLRPARGVEGLSPAPATRDGVRLGDSEPAETAASLALVDTMLGNLFEPDRQSMGMERFWSPDMMWYGPGGIGGTRGIDGFFRDHTDHWVEAIPDWRADLDTPHFAADAYVAFLGWPSIEATQTGDMLGVAPTGRRVEIRLMDFWRREGSKLAENWVYIDMVHMFRQLGVDLFSGWSAGNRRPASIPLDTSDRWRQPLAYRARKR